MRRIRWQCFGSENDFAPSNKLFRQSSWKSRSTCDACRSFYRPPRTHFKFWVRNRAWLNTTSQLPLNQYGEPPTPSHPKRNRFMTISSAEARLTPLIHRGISNARRMYGSLTNRRGWLSEAPEYLITVEIARVLGESLKRRHVNMEFSVREAMLEAGSTRRGRPRETHRNNGRFDILLSRKGGRPWCIIEVKSPAMTRNVLTNDIRRIRDTLIHRQTHESSISCAALAFYTDRDSKKQRPWNVQLEYLKEKSESLAKELLDERAKDRGKVTVRVSSGRMVGDRNTGSQSFCLFFVARRRRRSA